jgi:hypothetical protein
MANVRAWIAMSKLGGVVLSAFPDIGNKASLARHNGVGYFEGLGNGITSLVRDKSNAEREAMLDHVRGFSEAVAGSVFNRFSADSGLSGGMSRAMRTISSGTSCPSGTTRSATAGRISWRATWPTS